MSHLSPAEAADRISRALERIKRELPSAANVVDAFSDLLVESERLKAEISRPIGLDNIDAECFRQGVPLLQKEAFLVTAEDLKTAVERLTPPMARGLPKIADALMAVKRALVPSAVDPVAAMSDLLAGGHDALEEAAGRASIEPDVLKFALGWFVKPFVEKRAELLGPLPEDLEWFKGYCPICGSWPSLSLLREKEGQRWLRCSFCAHEWRFMRTKCPFCENEDQGGLEFAYSEDRPFERVEECQACKKYILGLDLRERDDVVLEVAAIGLIYLDILAQEHGLEPGAVTEWNVIGGS